MIPPQAVEAATDAMQQFALVEDRDGLQTWEAYARLALEAAAPHMQPNRKSLAEVLSGHQIQQGNRGMTPRCTCGWLGQVFGNDFHKDFITHQADMLTVALRTPDAR